ncbi:MAG: hypothetical protein NTU44_06080 [Bacteroidetes bacterium]|nr:hypothetical protein [Bacteroidota bacterium]
MKRILIIILVFACGISASPQQLFKSLKRHRYYLGAEMQKKLCEECFRGVGFLKNTPIVFDGEGLTMKQQDEVIYYIEFSRKEVSFTVEHWRWSGNFNSSVSDMNGEGYLCTSNDNENLLILTRKNNPSFKIVLKVVNREPFTLMLL